METFDRPIILIAGGYDKHTKLDKFMKTVKARVKCLILLGNAAARFKDEAEKAGIKLLFWLMICGALLKKGNPLPAAGMLYCCLRHVQVLICMLIMKREALILKRL